MSIDAALVQRLAREHYAIDVTPARAAELAAESARLESAVRAAAATLSFDTLPAAHAVIVHAAPEPRG